MDGPSGTTPGPLTDADALDALLGSPQAGGNGPARAADSQGTPEGTDPLESADASFRPATVSYAPTAEVSERRYAQLQALLGRLAEEPWKFDFFALVRRLQALNPEGAGVGESARVSEDVVRFCQEPSLAFAPAAMSSFKPARGTTPPRLSVNFMGMMGPNGPLPLHLTEYAHERALHVKDRTFARFLDIFNHRLISLMYRAWAVNQLPASFDSSIGRPITGAGPIGPTSAERAEILLRDRDRYATYVGSLMGFGMDSLRHRDSVPDTAKLHYAGRLAPHQRGPEGLRAILQGFFGVNVEIEEFAGTWMDLPPQYECRLGGTGSLPGSPRMDPMAARLGGGASGGASMGSRVWNVQGAFRMKLGPMNFEHYKRLLPGSRSERRLASWIRNYLGDEFSWEASVILQKEEVPRTALGGDPASGGARLGWTTWIRSSSETEDRADLLLRSKH